MESNNLISALAWISKGYAQKVPKEYELDEEELQQMKDDPLISQNLTRDLGKIQEQENDDEDDDDDDNLPVFCQEIQQLKGDINNNDQYPMGFEDMSDEEKEDYQIKASDLLIIAAKIENEFSSLEIYIYEPEKSNLFVHHEIQLSAFPLSIEWLPIQPTSIESNSAQIGNYAIVASFLPEIEIWNLDVVNILEPTVILGGEMEQNNKRVKNFKKKNKKFKTGSHTDSVITLGLNKFKQNILCSGSADTTVKLWDILEQKCVFTYDHHSSKLQITKWNLKEESILLTGAQDRKMILFDARTPKQIYQHTPNGELESACWDPINPHLFIYSTEQGQVVIMDARKIDCDPLCQFQASKKAVSSVSMSPDVQGMLATTSLEGKLSIYDTNTINSNGSLQLIAQETPKIGQLYCGQFSQDNTWTLACGSSQGELFVWDLQENQKIVQQFGDRVPTHQRPKIEDCSDILKPTNKQKRNKQREQIEEEN